MRQDRIAFRKSLGQFELRRIVAVVGAVAEEVNLLRPSEFVEERTSLVARNGSEALDGRLIKVELRPVAREDVRAFVAYVSRFDSDRGGQLVLRGEVVSVHSRQPLFVGDRAGEDAVGQKESAVCR